MNINITTSLPGAPSKKYDDLCAKSKRNGVLQTLSAHSSSEVSDTFNEMLKTPNGSCANRRYSSLRFTKKKNFEE